MSINLNNRIPKNVTGSAIAAGYVGEIVEATGMADNVSINSDAAWSGASLPLSAGIWRIFARIQIDAIIAGDAYVLFRLTNNSGTTINNQETRLRLQNANFYYASSLHTNLHYASSLCFDTVVKLTGSGTAETYKIYAAKTTVSGSATLAFRNAAGLYSTFYAVRIA